MTVKRTIKTSGVIEAQNQGSFLGIRESDGRFIPMPGMMIPTRAFQKTPGTFTITVEYDAHNLATVERTVEDA